MITRCTKAYSSSGSC